MPKQIKIKKKIQDYKRGPRRLATFWEWAANRRHENTGWEKAANRRHENTG